MRPEKGRRVYNHLVSASAREVLEIGTGHGVSTAYMAAALDETGTGMVTTIDHAAILRDPSPADILDRTGLTTRVRRIVIEDSSYTWWLKEEVEARSDGAGNCGPIYDFCYLDGAHNWTIDGLATVLIEKLLQPDGWLLLDDLNWSYAGSFTSPGQGPDDLRLSPAEQAT
jgi:predicted O-methyltransferase YrrM